MRGSLWLCRLLPAAFIACACVCVASADGPAISEANGLIGFKLGFADLGSVDGADRILNVDRVSGNPCPGNLPCGSLFSSMVTGTDNSLAGFAGFLDGQGALPIGERFGLQIDGDLGAIDGEGAGDAIGHLFWGDPGQGLIGPRFDYRAIDSANYMRLGAEGQHYFGNITLWGTIAYQWGEAANGIVVDDGVVGCGHVAYYPNENLMLLAGGGGGTGEGGGYGQVEWQAFPSDAPGLSFFAEGFAGTNGSAEAFGGLRYHFGAGKTLAMRHRTELPLRDTVCGFEQFVAPIGKTIVNLYRRE